MEATIKWLPTIPFPVPFDVQKRIQELRSYLDPNDPHYQPERQHINIKAAIKLYEDGKIDGVEQVHIMDGKVIPKKQIFEGPSCSWSEGRHYQFAEKQIYGHGPFGANFHEVSISLFVNARY
jgi:uncharacterized protein YbbK (DUF523 family)